MEERIQKHRIFLVDRIDPDFGLLEKLLASMILTREAVHEIKLRDNTTEKKNRILLDYILENKKANELVSALRDSGQIHLVNYLYADGDYRFEFEDDWPLNESEIKRLDANRESLMDLLDTSELCNRLYTEKVINNRQKQIIFSKPTDSEKNEALLEIMTKFSNRQYKKTIECLHDSKQSRIAKLLSEGGVVARVHANIEGTVGNVDQLEEEIISQLTKVLENRPLEEHHRLWELTQQRIIAARKGQSIVIYIHCMTNDELLQLIDLLKTDKLKGIIERVFIEMLSIREALRVSLTWSREEFNRASTYFGSVYISKMDTKELDSGDINKQGDLSDMITCCICTEVYTDPKVLPCNHTFCLKCIQETGFKTNKGPGDEMPCPICRQPFKIPQEGFPGLPKHFFIEKLIQLANVSDQSASSRAPCDVCVEENKEDGREIRAADTFCVDCKQKYCAECSRQHRKFKLNQNHKLIEIDYQDSGQNLMSDLASNVCESHGEMVLDVFCADCKAIVCAVCFVNHHNGHKGSHVSECMKQIESNIQAMNECRSIAQMKQAEFLEVKKNMQERVTKVECDVANRKEILKQLIDKHEASLLQGLCSTRQSKLKEIQLATDDIDTYLSCLETYNSYCQTIMAKGSASDICRAFSDLSARAVELQQQCQSMIEREFESINFRFRKSEAVDSLEESCVNFIGEIEEEIDLRQTKTSLQSQFAEQNELRYKSEPILVKTIRTNANKKKSISGLTILDKELFVVSHESSEVEVYDSMKFSFSRQWKLRELISPKDIASCNRNKCLYIFTYKGQSKEILRVDPNGSLIKKWSTGDDSGYGLSVTDESNVILTVYNKNKLNEYSPDGRLLREINLSLDESIRHPWHAIKLTNGHFAVCNDSDHHNVCTVDADGKLKKSFDGRSGSSVGQIGWPVYLSVDGNGFVMVADRMNSRVVLLDSDLKFQREILTKAKHGLGDLCWIHLDESSGRLFVADNGWDNKRILIFDFK